MNEKEIRLRDRASEPVPMWRQFGFALTEVAGNPIYTMMLAYITFFYSDVLGLDVGIVGVITLVSRIFDGVSDIIAGNIVDHTHTKNGSARPWIFRSGIMMALAYVLLFTVPNVGNVGKYIYVFFSYNFGMTIAYTLFSAGTNALPTYATTDVKSRSSMSAVRLIMAFIVQLVFSYAWLRVVAYFGDDQRAWIISAALMGTIAFISAMIVYFTSKENVVPSELTGQEDVPLKTAAMSILKNKYWFMILGMWFINTLHQTTTMTVGTYYAEYILNDAKLVGNMMLYHNIPAIAAMLIIPYLLQRGVRKQRVMLVSSIIYIIGAIVPLFGETSTMTLVISLGLRGMGQGLNNSVVMGMLSDTVDYGEWRTGVRAQGVTVNASTVGLKLGSGIGTALFGVILAGAGYDGLAAVQTPEAISCIKILFTYVPLFIYAAQLLLSLVYHLDDEMPQIQKDLEVRRSENLKKVNAK